jgi:hypothetical protein
MHSENTTGTKVPRVASLSGLKTRSFPASREVSMTTAFVRFSIGHSLLPLSL